LILRDVEHLHPTLDGIHIAPSFRASLYPPGKVAPRKIPRRPAVH
jgi:hypothetical protein